MTGAFRTEARRVARWLWWQSTLAVTAVCFLSAVMFTCLAESKTPTSTIVAILLGIPTVALSGLLAFDAYLFGMLARQADEASGGRAVDEFLAGAGLKPMPAQTRGLVSRIAGAKRLVYAHGAAAALFFLGFLYVVWIPET